MIKLNAFRITNFRSIVDSNWVSASPDGITVLVGQNESGKTSVLQALNYALNRGGITSDDKRIGADDPIVYLKITTTIDEINIEELRAFNKNHQTNFENYLNAKNSTVDIKCEWELTKKEDSTWHYVMSTTLVNAEEFIEHQQSIAATEAEVITVDEATADTDAATETSDLKMMSASDAAELIYNPLPYSVLFSAESGLLPSSVDIDDKGKPSGVGAVAASNFLSIAEIDLPKLMKGDARYRENILNKANKRVSDDFISFWSQIIGPDARLSLECEFQHYSNTAADKAGKPHLVFWISDGTTKLYPKQRSLGVRWFVSFYLQLSATKKSGIQKFFLLDEPGANLHAKAQADVLKLVNELRKDITILYSTHSPQMIEYEKLYRVRAVQRDGSKEDSPTVVIDGHLLGSASTDTLSPILAAMGTDMSNQTVIQKHRNVLLEEISGYYYLKAFWKLTHCNETAHFIAATGVNKLPTLVNMFVGWGLDFVVAVDDDKQGRDVFKQLKRDLCGDQDELAKKCLLKIPDCTSIEDAFTAKDFADHVLKNPSLTIKDGNAEHLKNSRLSKPVTALQFLLSVENRLVTLDLLETETQLKIKNIVNAIVVLLQNQKLK